MEEVGDQRLDLQADGEWRHPLQMGTEMAVQIT